LWIDKNIKKLRKQKNYCKVGFLLTSIFYNTGIKQKMGWSIITPSIVILQKLAKVVNVSVNDLLK
jgi:hypothetical protein